MCRVLLRMSDREFLKRTPHEVAMLMDANITRMEIEDGRFGVLCSLIANIHRDKKKQAKGFTPVDFMPNRRNPGASAKKGKKQSTQEQIQHLKAVTALFGGSIAPRFGAMTQKEAANWLKSKN